MYIIGVTGGIGAGKSEILDYMCRRWGASVIRLDDVARELMQPGGAAYGRTVELFGECVVRDDGTLDRGLIAKLIFGDEAQREALDAVIHPEVKRETLRRIGEEEKLGTRLICIEAALLIEDHYDAICNELWYIYAGETTRYSRLASSRGYDEERVRATMARQLTEEEFRRHTDYVVDNDGDFERARELVDSRIREILERESAGNQRG